MASASRPSGNENVAEVVAAYFIGRLIIVVEIDSPARLGAAAAARTELHLLGRAQFAAGAERYPGLDCPRADSTSCPAIVATVTSTSRSACRSGASDRSCRDTGCPAGCREGPISGAQIIDRLLKSNTDWLISAAVAGPSSIKIASAGGHHVQRRFAADRPKGHAVARLALAMLDGAAPDAVGPLGQQDVAADGLRKNLEQAVENLGQDLVDVESPSSSSEILSAARKRACDRIVAPAPRRPPMQQRPRALRPWLASTLTSRMGAGSATRAGRSRHAARGLRRAS